MPTLGVIGYEQDGQAARECLAAFERYWTGDDAAALRMDFVTFDEALESRDEAARWDAALICATGAMSDSQLYSLISLLDELMTPGVVLDTLHAVGDRAGMTTDCLFACGPEGVRAAPAMLYAVARRQSSVRSMTAGMAAAQSFQTEAAAEIDRLHDELLLAAQVQREMLPKALPELEGMSCGALFRPASYVSGDIYDIDRLDESHVGFFLADAMGHGVPAALMTLFISGSLPQKEIIGSSYRLISPAASLAHLNRSMCASRVGQSRFATAVCGIIEPRTRRVTLASAGHPHSLRVRPGKRENVELSGPLLGVFDEAEFEETSFILADDELLVIHSDGLEEVYAPRDATSKGDVVTRHLEALAQLGRCAGRDCATRILEHLAQDLDSQAGSLHQTDDVTVLLFAPAA